MKPVQKILVPYDVTSNSPAALELAIDLARRYDASLTVVYVDQPLTYALPETYLVATPEQLADAQASLDRDVGEAERTARMAGVLNVQTRVLRGDASAEILRFAKDQHADLIVMGTHGRRGLQHALLGSVAERVVRGAPCPTLTVRN